MLPFKTLPIMRDQKVYRMPSVESIFNIMKKHSESRIPFIDPKQSFVLLNPDQSFPNAEELLLPQLTSKGVMVIFLLTQSIHVYVYSVIVLIQYIYMSH